MDLSNLLANRPLAILPGYALDQKPLRAAPAAGTLGTLAVIPIQGVLVHGYGAPEWGAVGYADIRDAFFAALDDSSVSAIAMLINSPGGMVSGLFNMADTIHAARGIKPIVAVLDESAYSAAYCLAAAADMIVVPESGGTGSIGAVCIHTEITGMLDKIGIRATIIRSAPQKMEGNEMEPLSDEAKARAQADIDALADMFIQRVADWRGISAKKIRAMQAGTFLGQAGVDAGLADVVMPPDAAIAELLVTLGS